MVIKGGFNDTTKTQVRKTLKYLGISRSQLERELVEQGATTHEGMIFPLQRWFATHGEQLDPLSLMGREVRDKYDEHGRDKGVTCAFHPVDWNVVLDDTSDVKPHRGETHCLVVYDDFELFHN